MSTRVPFGKEHLLVAVFDHRKLHKNVADKDDLKWQFSEII